MYCVFKQVNIIISKNKNDKLNETKTKKIPLANKKKDKVFHRIH